MKIDSNDISEMRRLEKELNDLREEYDYHWCAVEGEYGDDDFHEVEMVRIGKLIEEVEHELDIIGGFNGE